LSCKLFVKTFRAILFLFRLKTWDYLSFIFTVIQYYIKTQRCKYGSKCKFNHPREEAAVSVETQDSLPERPSEPMCTFYMKTGKCKFGLSCKFHHPKDIQLPSSSQDIGSSVGLTSEPDATNNPHVTFTPALYHNSKGLPVRSVMNSSSLCIRLTYNHIGTICDFLLSYWHYT
jgi:hypothetical protein